MALVKCRECGKEISDKAIKCVHCGTTDFLKKDNEIIESQTTTNINEKNTIKKDENLTIKELKQELETTKIENLQKEKELERTKNEKLQKELELEKIKNENLKNEMKLEKAEKEKKELQNKMELNKKKTKKETKNYFIQFIKIFVNIIRYFIACFLCLGSIVCLISGEFLIGLDYLILGIPFFPFVYKLIWKNKKISKKTKIISQIITPIIAFIIFLILGGIK